MSTYNAGEIEASASLDRDPFIEGLRVCWAEGDRFSRARFTATADIDTRGMARAMAELEAYRALAARVRAEGAAGASDQVRLAQNQQRIDQAALRDAQRAAQARARLEQDAMAAARRDDLERARLRQQAWRDEQRIDLARQAMAQRAEQLGRNQSRTTQQETKDFQLMRVAIEQLGPPLVPLAGAALGYAAALGALGAAGIEAFVGIKNEIKNNTDVGMTYLGLLGSLKGANAELSKTSAAGFMAGAETGTAKLLQGLPMVNGLLGDMSVELGDIVQHLVGGLIGGLPNFIGLIHQGADSVDHMAARFESWASGPGGASFAHTLSQDMAAAGPAIANIWHLLERVVGAFNGPGLAMLTNLGRLSAMLAKLPTGAFEALVTGYLAFRTAVAITTGIDKATVSWLRLAAAEREAAVAGGAAGAGGAARMGLMGKIGRGLGIGLGVDVAAQMVGGMADNSGWNTSTNSTQFALGHIGSGLGQLADLNFSGAWSTLFGDKRKQDQALVDKIRQGQRFNAMFSDPGAGWGLKTGMLPMAERTSALSGNTGGSVDPATYMKHLIAATQEYSTLLGVVGQKAAKALTFDADPLLRAQETMADRVRRLQGADYRRQIGGTDTAEGLFNISMQQTSQVSQASGMYDQIDQSLQGAISSKQKFLKLGGDEQFQYKGLTIGSNTWSAALKKTNGDQEAARALIEGTVDAMGHQQTQLDVNVIRQGRVNAAVQEAETRWKLTGDQVDMYTGLLGINADMLGRGVITGANYVAMIGDVAKAVSNGSTAMQGWVAAVGAFNSSGKGSGDRGALIGAALKAAQGDALSYENTVVQASVANQQFVTDLGNMKKGVINLKTGVLDYHNAAAAPLLADLQNIQNANVQVAAAVYQHELAQSKDTDTVRAGKKAADDAYNTYINNTRRSLIDEADKMGLTGQAAKNFIDHYMKIADAPDVKKNIELIGGDQTQQALTGILQDLDHMSGLDHSQVFDISAHVSVTGTQSIPGKLLGELGWVADGAVFYANGGTSRGERHVAGIYSPQPRFRMFAEPETGGEAYIPLAPHKRPRSQQIAKETVHRLGGVAHFAEGGGYTGVVYPSGGIGSTASGGSSSSSGGSSGSSVPRGRWSSSDWSAIQSALQGAEAWVNRATNGGKAATSILVQMENAIWAATKQALTLNIVPHSFAQAIADDNARLENAVKHREAVVARLAVDKQKWQDLRSQQIADVAQVRDTTMGAWDVGTSGSGYAVGIESTLSKAVADAQKFMKYRDEAVKMGLDPRLITQIVHEGPTTAGANLEAIVNAGKSYIQTINKEYGQLADVATEIGRGAGGGEDFNARIAAAMAQTAADNHRLLAYQASVAAYLKELVRDGKTLDDRLVAALRQGKH